MIKIEKKDSIIDVIIKIDNCKSKEIVLDFPFGHSIIHSYTSLKILKNKAKNKELVIITNDKSAKKIGKKLGIKYSSIGDQDLVEYNYSFWEYTKYLSKHYFNELLYIFGNKNNDIISTYQKKYSKANPKIGFFLIGLIISILLFLFVFYFAVNKTYIYINPEISIKTKAKNFIFKEVKEDEIVNNNIIKLNKVSKLVYLTETFGTSGFDEKTIKRSHGIVEFYNELEEDINLLQNTRLETQEGILFTTDTNVFIPKATFSGTGVLIPGKSEIKISSKIYNSKGKSVGIKANIEKDILLQLPGLKTNRDKIYAKTIIKTVGATDNFEKQLKQEDIKNAKILLEGKLKQEALNQLKAQIKKDNKQNNTFYQILSINKILKYSNFNILGEDKLKIGENIENFKLGGTIKITSYTFNTKKVLNELSTTIKESILENIEKLLFIDENSLRISNILNKEKYPFKIKATAQVEVFMSHNFLDKNSYLIEKLKNNIAGIPEKEAYNILLNNKNISDVEIELRPFFVKNISKINNNILIKIREEKR